MARLVTAVLLLLAFVGVTQATDAERRRHHAKARTTQTQVGNINVNRMNRYASMSFLTYCNRNKYDDLKKGKCTCGSNVRAGQLENFDFFGNSQGDNFGYVALDKANGQIIVAFRGTTPSKLGNIKTDFATSTVNAAEGNWVGDYVRDALDRGVLRTEIRPQVNLWRLPAEAKMHRGFRDAYAWVREGMMNKWWALKGSKSFNKFKTIVIGHSLGGAMATIAAVDMATMDPALELWTYGSPRVGNSEFATWFSNTFIARSFRVVNKKDPVVHAPTTTQGFVHVTAEHWLENGPGSPPRNCGQIPDNPICSFSVGVKPLSGGDHLGYTTASCKCDDVNCG